MNLTVINDQAGSSSSMKMIRSIFMKGFTALLLETLMASHQAGVEKEIVDSISGTLSNGSIEKLMNLLLTRTAIHAERRVSEMKDVVETLADMDLDSTMSQAAQKKLQSLVDLKLNSYFDFKAPEHYRQVLEGIAKLQDQE
jgi:3-hydroxyisobutyrate dehydrogenase-like beta-hydroxyacid dehydrogenase